MTLVATPTGIEIVVMTFSTIRFARSNSIPFMPSRACTREVCVCTKERVWFIERLSKLRHDDAMHRTVCEQPKRPGVCVGTTHKTRETQNASHNLHAPKAPRGYEQLHRNAVFATVGTTATHNPCACTRPSSSEIDRTDRRTCVRLAMVR